MRFEIHLRQENEGEMTRVTCEPISRDPADYYRKLLSESNELPENWASLDWHRLHQAPCLWGADTFVAVTEDLSTGYVVFDDWCATFDRATSKHPWNSAREFFELDAKIGCGHVDADDARGE